jgi:hypothetical protein
MNKSAALDKSVLFPVMVFNYPTSADHHEHKERMSKLSEMLAAGWRFQGGPYIIGSVKSFSPPTQTAQVILARI